MLLPTARGTYFDGNSAKAHPVILRLSDRLELSGPDVAVCWDLPDLVAGETAAPLSRLGPKSGRGQVEFLDQVFGAALAARCPDLHRRVVAERSGRLRLVLWSVAASGAAILMALYGVPALASRLAPLVPAVIEARLGEAVDRQVLSMLDSPARCDQRDGVASLDRLSARLLRDSGLPDGIQISVHAHRTPNAFTLPGGRMIVLSGLIDQTDTPDELAAVLAHEFGHMVAHDPMRGLIAATGTSLLLSMVIGDLTGSTVLIALGQAALSAGYSRDAESAADAFAVNMVRNAGGDASALAAILERIDHDEDRSSPAVLRSHPFTRERARISRSLAGPKQTTTGLLNAREWAALKDICED
ncbi:M48 family metallopeptidase [Methylobacterium sp. BTF04]|nr:M48 family metallopeptidase [Methylobacterium sp. BTF04]NEU13801.1 M48 family metallopeptidase [Methylobacterium sp. BTF04]